MTQEQFDEMIIAIRDQHEKDLESLIEYLRKTINPTTKEQPE